MDDLFLFIRESSADLALAGNAALMGALPPGPRSLSLWANGPRHDMRHAAAGLLALWHRPPLRLPSGRAVSCVRRAILTCEALGASHFSQSKSKIRFCSDSMSGFAPVLSGFAPAPTGRTVTASPSHHKKQLLHRRIIEDGPLRRKVPACEVLNKSQEHYPQRPPAIRDRRESDQPRQW